MISSILVDPPPDRVRDPAERRETFCRIDRRPAQVPAVAPLLVPIQAIVQVNVHLEPANLQAQENRPARENLQAQENHQVSDRPEPADLQARENRPANARLALADLPVNARLALVDLPVKNLDIDHRVGVLQDIDHRVRDLLDIVHRATGHPDQCTCLLTAEVTGDDIPTTDMVGEIKTEIGGLGLPPARLPVGGLATPTHNLLILTMERTCTSKGTVFTTKEKL